MSDNEQIDIPELVYLPRNLYFRLNRRNAAKYFVIYYYAVLLIMILIGSLFLNSVYMTRNYIVDGDAFWNKSLKNSKLLKLQSFNAFTGIFLICTGVFSIMNNTNVILHVFRGGLRKRMEYANYVGFFFQIIVFVYSLVTLIMFTDLIYLYPILFVFSFYNLLNATLYYLVIRRSVRKERKFMISIKRMKMHRDEYKSEYFGNQNLNQINQRPAVQINNQ